MCFCFHTENIANEQLTTLQEENTKANIKRSDRFKTVNVRTMSLAYPLFGHNLKMCAQLHLFS
jgi:hypothetical protein